MTTIRTLVLSVLLAYTVPSAEAATAITASPFLTGLSNPILLTYAPGDSARVFIVEQGGRIRIAEGDTLHTNPFLNISSKLVSGGERGLLGLAFHPDYQSNGYLFVYYTASSPLGQTTVERYTVSGDPDVADASSGEIIITVPQPESNHNGGMMAFSPVDGYLYIGLGDGGGAGDPGNNAQDSTSALGKMLRLNVDSSLPYAIPASNPHVGTLDTLPEIWAHGLRNPWRWSFDRATGDLWIADVGQGNWEEINVQYASSLGGENYGWRLKEGDHCYNPSSGCETGQTLVDPIHEYSHTSGCSITGGYVYRGCGIPDLQGTYFFADYCSGTVWSLTYDGNSVAGLTDRTGELGVGSFGITSFGEDARGELHILYSNGTILKIVPDGLPDQCNAGPCCEGGRGNIFLAGNCDNSDTTVDVGDLTSLIDHLFINFPALCCPEEADLAPLGGPDGGVDVGDLTTLIDHLFITFPALPICN